MKDPGFDIDFGLTGKVALVTGAAQGIGSAIAGLYARKGADIVLVDRLELVNQTAETMSETGREILPLTADLTEHADVCTVVREAVDRFARIDILVNCAGVALLDAAEDLSADWWDRTIAVNLTAPFVLSQLVALEMKRTGGGKIINLASQAGVIALERHVAYCSSKAGLIGMTKALALEWAKYKITVNAISPTVVLTELGKKAWAGAVGEDMKAKIPVGRFAQPDEIAAAAVFLASGAADMITGENLIIDGGYTIQ